MILNIRADIKVANYTRLIVQLQWEQLVICTQGLIVLETKGEQSLAKRGKALSPDLVK